MTKIYNFLIILCSLLTVVACGPAHIEITVIAPSKPAYGFKEMCGKTPNVSVCGAVDTSTQNQLITTKDVDEFIKIHKKVYSRFTYLSDMKQFNVMEYWVYPDDDYNMLQYLKGDCEDFSFAVIKAAKDANIKGIKMLFVVDTGKKIGHVIALLGNRVSDVNFEKTYALNTAVTVNKYKVYKVFDVDSNNWYNASVN